MERRSFIRAGLAASAVPTFVAAAAAAKAHEADQHRIWFDQWRELRDRWRNHGHDETGEETSLGASYWDAADELEMKMASTVAKTPDGAAAQIEMVLADSEPTDLPVGHREALILAVQALKGWVA